MLHQTGAVLGACHRKVGSMLTTSIQPCLHADMHADLSLRLAQAHSQGLSENKPV